MKIYIVRKYARPVACAILGVALTHDIQGPLGYAACALVAAAIFILTEKP